MKHVQQLSKPTHKGIVFINYAAATKRDMTAAVAIVSDDMTELAILDSDHPEVIKLRALLAAGFKPSFGKLESGNYYLCQKAEADDSMNEAVVSSDLPNNNANDPAPVSKRPVVYKKRVIGFYDESTDELEIDDEYHIENHDYLLTEPEDKSHWEIEEDSELDRIVTKPSEPQLQPQPEIKPKRNEYDLVKESSNFYSY
ncbi:hypothetical protein E4625_09715 [Aeromonas hydrophila]|uniref:hypothetical protein n=1 Tax=Aeromonas hydrophila TaxID=644 RepID=UPI000FD15B77|nr:hypothetical protein [Aeromonas hydrophila]AZU48381.1 hypothetical protein C3B79_2623 [Aeromonas hydrophila]QBX71088.1 hypothetical protein E4625_09715 [Aeromonas hydrophila]